ncbi:Fic family protein [Companilactobacillus muriivasis]|uniref:Fic family protein n=1 Tax=Companilactobacillus muriivasis TaxID=3081444 RepID=UPI0030C755A8
MDNTKLARFITSLGSLNDYGSTVTQTKKALDIKSSAPLEQNNHDVAIFVDAVNGIETSKKMGFSAVGIIAINRSFNSSDDEEPNIPGHLRNAMWNEDDRIVVTTDSRARQSDNYFPPEVVTQNDLSKIVEEYKNSPKTEKDAWRVFASISKLQPFQDGNKRTALISANSAYETWENENYLVLPFNDLDRADFTIQLMRYYKADSKPEENKYLDRMIDILPSTKEREAKLRAPLSPEEISKEKLATTYKVKPQFRNKNSKNS